jgi:hypothetical protein
MSSHHSVIFSFVNITMWRRHYCCDTGVQYGIDKTEETSEKIKAINELQYKEKSGFAESVYQNGIRLSTLVIKFRMKCIQAQVCQAAPAVPVSLVKLRSTHLSRLY